MKDETTILLYALSTIAQTGAALAALVGAVGLYRLQLLLTSHERSEDTIKGIMAERVSQERSIDQVVDEAERLLAASLSLTADKQLLDKIQRGRLTESIKKWKGYAPRARLSRYRLIGFEVWNLLVIGGSLLAFNHVEFLAQSAATPWLIGIAAVGTVAVTVLSVWKWSGD